MKATIEVPDDLYRRVKAKSALQGRAIRDVTEELYRRWLDEGSRAIASDAPRVWLEDWLNLADKVMAGSPAGPTAREHLEHDRRRLERE